eukprot:scaffold104772_cov16-Prasinocladus_malaysianus.AAC.1
MSAGIVECSRLNSSAMIRSVDLWDERPSVLEQLRQLAGVADIDDICITQSSAHKVAISMGSTMRRTA